MGLRIIRQRAAPGDPLYAQAVEARRRVAGEVPPQVDGVKANAIGPFQSASG